jgi:hypothetical protein
MCARSHHAVCGNTHQREQGPTLLLVECPMPPPPHFKVIYINVRSSLMGWQPRKHVLAK